MSIDSLLARQAGVISREQAHRAGLSRDAIDHLVRRRRWRPLHPHVYLAAGHRLDDEVAVRGAVLWAGDGAVLSGCAAAWWHGMADRAPTAVRVTVPRHRNPRGRPAVDVRRRALDPVDVTEVRGIAVTARPLTVVEASVDLGGRFLDRALQRTVRFPTVYAAHCRNLGAQGSARAGQLLIAAADRSASEAERLLVRMLRASGARGWHCGLPASGFLIDIAFPEAMVAVEIDGWAWHMDAVRAQADKRRQNVLVRAGWTVLRYTWHDLVERPGAVLAEIGSEVRRARRAR
ncbi:type IV toxin-antitoxin system AbiEi family antitoxin domain-containing protein [Pseudonocardia abyssalis]|uniref:DUF559 domain-containing protein n=1 Tax=Pseudonocardia abyssalis TaxID=2792008 RepID=A0ABS6UX79_9PSEU|nr:type IV toxin-antitoxin system AbiEi family antitoxin domain-containing protein [Pseudonocardia abyssalis]MBW0118783.1 DUF559 domain-containing protein [Pseudonocardia abyssalis]MBW0136468.1 DUF559 domain-containing protein [Pseudonocardia abyssalis]